MAVNGWSTGDVEADGLKRGQVVENFVLQQVRPEAEVLGAKMYHFRNSAGSREVDLIVEDLKGDLIAIEVKASITVNDDDAKHLRWFQKEQGVKVKAAVILYAGPNVLRLRDGVIALPISSLWA